MTDAARRILFVDDATDLLDGLRNGLRSERRAWQMRFADGGEAALRLLEAEPAEVVITDMRMPGMDGLELLRRVQQRWPETVRMVLSGQADLSTVIRASAVAHQYLAKPCDLPVLRGVISRALSTIDRLPVPALRRVLGGLGSLPLGPSVGRAMGVALTRDEVDLRALAPLVEVDAGMTARLLQFANSPYCGLAQPVIGVEAALLYLGSSTVRMLADTVEPLAPAGAGIDPTAHPALVRHAVLAARLARRLTRGRSCCDAAYAAALLHQAGELVIMSRLPERWSEVRRVAGREGRTRYQVERALLGADHAQLGAYLLGLWGLPADVVEAVERFHEPPGGPEPASVTLGMVRLAGLLAHELGDPDPGALSDEERGALEIIGGDDLPVWRSWVAEEAAALGLGPAR